MKTRTIKKGLSPKEQITFNAGFETALSEVRTILQLAYDSTTDSKESDLLNDVYSDILALRQKQ